MSLFELWFSQDICPVVGLLGHMVSKKKKKEIVLGQDRNKDADIENGLDDTGRGKGRAGRIGRLGLTYIHYHV